MKKLLLSFFALLCLGSVTTVWATDYYVAHDDNIGGLSWTNNKEKMTAKGDGTYYLTFFAVPNNTNAALKITLGNWANQINNDNLNTSKSNITFSATDGDKNVKFTTSSLQNITIWTDGTEMWVVAEDPYIKQEVLNGSQVMFYYGSPTSWGQNTMYFLTSANKPNENGYALSGKSYEWKSGYYSAVGLYALNSSTTYNLSNNNDWTGNEKSGLTAGCFADMNGSVTGNTSFVCTLGATSYSMTQGEASVAITSSVSGTSGLGLSYSLDGYYISADGTSWSAFDPSNASSLAQGSYTIKALATDGHIYMVSTNSATLTVNAPAAGSHDITATTATKWTYGSLPASQTAGELVEFTVTPNDGYSVEVSSSDVTITKNGNTYSFTMPDNDVAITVTPTALSYNITYPTTPSHYTLAVGNPASGNTDATINFTATPDANYFLTVTVNGDEVVGVSNVYSFTMPAEDVTIAITASTYRTFDGSTPLYLNAGAISWWMNDNAVQKATFTKADNSTAVVTGVLEEGNVYAFTPEAGSYKSVQFSRHNPNNVSEDWGHTDHISLIGTDAHNYVSSFEQNATSATWSTFTPAPSYTFTSGTTIYIDFTAITEGAKGVNYPNPGNTSLDWVGDGAGTVIPVTFTANVKWSTNQAFIKTEKNGWVDQNFIIPASGNNCVVVTADGASYSWTTIVPPPPTISLHSNLTNPSWEGSADFEVATGNETASLTLSINQGDSYEFGVKVDGNWRANGAAFDRFNNSAVIPAGNSGNCTFIADVTGSYTFTWTYATNTLSVEYPEALSVAFDGMDNSYFVGNNVTLAANSNLTNVSYAFQVKVGDGEFASAASPYTFAAAGTYTFKVTATGNEGSKDATKVVTVYEPLTLYLVNKDAWTNPSAYAYGAGEVKNANWPGEAMTATGASTAGHSYGVYSIVIAKNVYSNIIFSNNANNQTSDLTFDEATPYYYNGTWYATLAECDPAAASKQTYHLYVRKFVGWSEFDIYAWGDEEYLGAWPGKTAEDNTVVIDGATYSVYDFEAVPGDITMHLIFNNNGPGEGQEGDYRQLLDITEAKNCTIVVNDLAAWEGLAGEKRFRPYIPMEHIYGYQYDEYGTVGGAEWPGTELTPDAEGWYSFIVNKGRTVIFNNGVGADAMQTGDLAYTDEDPVADECAVWQGETNVAGEPAKTYMVTSSDCDAAIAIAYERNVTSGNYGTICLPYSAIRVEGATLYSIVGKSGDGHGYGEGIYIEQEDNLVMGKPYIFLANADKLVVRYWEGQSFTPSGDHLYTNNGLVGFINDGQNHLVAQDAHNFILYNNGLYYVDSEAYIASYRAFIDWSNITNVQPSSGAPRRYIGVNKVATGVENINNAAQSTKVLHNGMLLIERNGNIYNAVGQKIQ